jgi:putative transposase
MERPPYPSDLSDAEWERLRAALPKPKKPGRPPKYARREMWNAIFYQDRTGCQWRALPRDLPPWEDVWEHFRRWKKNGWIAAAHAALRDQVRRQAGKEASPSVGILDSQSVRTPQKGGPTATTRVSK